MVASANWLDVANGGRLDDEGGPVSPRRGENTTTGKRESIVSKTSWCSREIYWLTGAVVAIVVIIGAGAAVTIYVLKNQ
jgi:hypothetical protein